MQESNRNTEIRDIRYNRLVPEVVLRYEHAPGIYRIPLDARRA